MQTPIKNIFTAALILSFMTTTFSTTSLAQTTTGSRQQEEDFLKQLDYPELLVVPRATERLNMEAQNENNFSALTLWPHQLSALATLASGFMHKSKYRQDNPSEQQKKDSDDAALAAMGVGGIWIGLSLFYSLRKPYTTSLSTVRSIKGNDKKSELMRERLAEEALEQPAHVVDSLTYLSVATNFAASMYVLAYARQDQRYFPAISALLAFTPLVFQSRYSESHRKHLEYKKKIYAPIFGYGIDEKFRPQFQVSMQF